MFSTSLALFVMVRGISWISRVVKLGHKLAPYKARLVAIGLKVRSSDRRHTHSTRGCVGDGRYVVVAEMQHVQAWAEERPLPHRARSVGRRDRGSSSIFTVLVRFLPRALVDDGDCCRYGTHG